MDIDNIPEPSEGNQSDTKDRLRHRICEEVRLSRSLCSSLFLSLSATRTHTYAHTSSHTCERPKPSPRFLAVPRSCTTVTETRERASLLPSLSLSLSLSSRQASYRNHCDLEFADFRRVELSAVSLHHCSRIYSLFMAPRHLSTCEL